MTHCVPPALQLCKTSITAENHISEDEEDSDGGNAIVAIQQLHVLEYEPPEEVPPTIPANTNQIIPLPAPRRPTPDDNYTYITDDDTAFVSKYYLGIDPASGLIEVFVHLNKKENFILYRTDTIETLKRMVTERKGIPIDMQRFVFAGRILQNQTTLQENKILCGSIIHLFLRLRGGTPNY